MFQVKNVMEMRKTILFVIGSVLLMAGIGLTLSACSSDEELKGVSVEFKLLNESGEDTTIFTEGENIIFKLEIRNDNTEEVKMPALFDIVGPEIFHVYSSDGKDLGKPWDSFGSDFLPFLVIHSKSSFVFTCSWLDNDLEEDLDYYPYVFRKESAREPLPKGEYYSKFTINLGHGIKKTCKQTFIIEDKEDNEKPVIEPSCDCAEEEGVAANYKLLNKDSEEVAVFHVGDEIFFRLTICNNTDHALKYDDEIELISSAFIVYTKEGKYVNPAYIYSDEMMHPVNIPSGGRNTWGEKWMRDPLPVGEYYSTFILDVKGQSEKIYRVDFKVIE